MRISGSGFEAVSKDNQLLLSEGLSVAQHLLADILAHGEDGVSIDIEPSVREMQVLAPMEGRKIRRLGPSTGPKTDPTGRPGVGMDQVDMIFSDEPPQGQDIQQPLQQTSVIDGDRGDFRPNGVVKPARRYKNLVTGGDLPPD
jgi:hypothetical protein